MQACHTERFEARRLRTLTGAEQEITILGFRLAASEIEAYLLASS